MASMEMQQSPATGSNLNSDKESQMLSSSHKRGLVVYLIEEFNVKSIDATQIANVVNSSIKMVPIIVLPLTATLGSLRPQCETGSISCHGSSKLQFAILYIGITLASIGLGVVRFTLATLGANQFDNSKDQGVFFNWFFVIFYAAIVVSSRVIVYVEDNISWGLGCCQ